MPKRTYFSTHENRQTVRVAKDMNFKDRVSGFVWMNASGTEKVKIAIIGKAKSLRCVRCGACPLNYSSQANALSDSAIFRMWWLEVFRYFYCALEAGLNFQYS